MRFFDAIGFGVSVEKRPGVWDTTITERKYSGDVAQNTQAINSGSSVNTVNTFQTTISVVGDDYALENFTAIKYVRWAGSLWTVNSVQTRRPRLILMIGEVYNGPTAPAPATP